MPILRVDSQELPLSAVDPSLSATSMLSLASQAHAFHQPVGQRLSWLHHWSIPHVHLSFRIRSRSSMPSHASNSFYLVVTMSCGLTLQSCLIIALSFTYVAADVGGLVLSVAKSHWHGALHSAHKSWTCGHVSWKRGGRKRKLVAAPWTPLNIISGSLRNYI